MTMQRHRLIPTFQVQQVVVVQQEAPVEDAMARETAKPAAEVGKSMITDRQVLSLSQNTHIVAEFVMEEANVVFVTGKGTIDVLYFISYMNAYENFIFFIILFTWNGKFFRKQHSVHN